MQRIVNAKAATPFAQRNFLATVRAMFEWGVNEGRMPENPALGERLSAKSKGYKVCSEEEVIRKWADAAGCPDVSAHGLRRRFALTLAERGASNHHIMSLMEHASSS